MRRRPKDEGGLTFGFFPSKGDDPRAKLTYVVCDVPWWWCVVSRDGELKPVPDELADVYTPEMWRGLARRFLKSEVKEQKTARAEAALRRFQKDEIEAKAAALGIPAASTGSETRVDPGAYIASQLKLARKKCGLTQMQAAPLLKRSQSYVSKCESGKHQPSEDEIARFAELYGQPEQFFVPESDLAK